MEKTFNVYFGKALWQYSISRFPGGELNLRFDDPEGLRDIWNRDDGCDIMKVVIERTCNTPDKFMELALLKNAIENIFMESPKFQKGRVKYTYLMYYTPYARQDRVCNLGEAHSLKVMANLINTLNFDKVYIADPHSDVAAPLFNNCVIIDSLKEQRDGFDNYIRKLDVSHIVSPDAGALKKVEKFFGNLKTTNPNLELIRATKNRDVVTGALSNPTLLDANFLCEKKTALIIDDICDGGGTFIQLAKVLKDEGFEKVALYVTHGIFSRGLDPLYENGIDYILTTNSFKKYSDEEQNDKFIVL